MKTSKPRANCMCFHARKRTPHSIMWARSPRKIEICASSMHQHALVPISNQFPLAEHCFSNTHTHTHSRSQFNQQLRSKLKCALSWLSQHNEAHFSRCRWPLYPHSRIHTHVTCTHVSIKHFCSPQCNAKSRHFFAVVVVTLIFRFIMKIFKSMKNHLEWKEHKFGGKSPNNSSNNGRIFNLFVYLWVASYSEWWKFDRKGGGGALSLGLIVQKHKKDSYIL